MALENVTVNGKPAKEYVSEQRSREIQQFLAEEFRSFGRISRRHISSSNGSRNQSRPVASGNNSIRYAN